MASTSCLVSLSSSTTHFTGSQMSTKGPNSQLSGVSFRRPLRLFAACITADERIASGSHIGLAGSLYEVLGIQRSATCQEIKAAYRRLARVVHPDVATNGQKGNNNNNNSNSSEFIKIHEAYETLSNPEKRTDYDWSLYQLGWQMSSSFVTSATTSATSSSSFTRRRWETDQCW